MVKVVWNNWTREHYVFLRELLDACVVVAFPEDVNREALRGLAEKWNAICPEDLEVDPLP